MYAIYFFPRDKKYDRNVTETIIVLYPLTIAMNIRPTKHKINI